MSKKILSLISFLFLLSVLAISCSNTGKTGSDDSNSGTGDGGTTTQGIAKHAGTWILKETTTGNGSGTMIISEDGSVNLKELNLNGTDVTDKGNETYEVKFTIENVTSTLILTFISDTSGSYDITLPDGQHIGTLTKQQ